MKDSTIAVFAVFLVFGAAHFAGAQTYDHLKCYKLRDVKMFRRAYADIEALRAEFGLQNCQIKPKAKLYCSPADKQVTDIEEGSDAPFAADELAFDRACYKIKCPTQVIPALEISDQFGTRTADGFKVSMLCTPAVVGPPPTTTTTTSTTTTTTSTTTTVPSGSPFALRFGDAAAQTGVDVVVDSAGNAILSGVFEGSIDFGGGPLTSAGGTDVFVAKFDNDGNHLWSKKFGDAGTDIGYRVALDSSDNLWMAGGFSGNVDFGGGTLTSVGSIDAFLVKLDAAGTHVLSRQFGDTGAAGVGIAVDADDNVIFGGLYGGMIDFGGGAHTSIGLDAFVAKLDSAGTFVWSQGFGDSGGDRLTGLTVDSGDNVLLIGTSDGDIDLGGGVLTGAGSTDVFVAKLSSAGAHVWSDLYGDSDAQNSWDIVADSLDDVVVTGSFAGAVDFGGGALASAGDDDAFIAKLGSAGAHVWSQRHGDTGADRAFGAVVRSAGNVVVIGSFSGSVDFGGGALASAGGQDVFALELDAAGAHVTSARYGDTDEQFGGGIAIDATGARFLTGTFAGSIDFGSGALVSSGLEDVFFAKLVP